MYVDRAPHRSGINQDPDHSLCHADQSQQEKLRVVEGAARDVVGIRRGAISGNMKVSFQAARSIG